MNNMRGIIRFQATAALRGALSHPPLGPTEEEAAPPSLSVCPNYTEEAESAGARQKNAPWRRGGAVFTLHASRRRSPVPAARYPHE